MAGQCLVKLILRSFIEVEPADCSLLQTDKQIEAVILQRNQYELVDFYYFFSKCVRKVMHRQAWRNTSHCLWW